MNQSNRKVAIEKATQRWVSELNAIPKALIQKAYGNDCYSAYIKELTLFRKGDKVYLLNPTSNEYENGEIAEVDYDKETVVVDFDNGDEERIGSADLPPPVQSNCPQGIYGRSMNRLTTNGHVQT